MKCLYCDEDYYKNSSIIHYLFDKDPLCERCRQALIFKPNIIKKEELKVKSFYIYNKMFSSLILQYKECMDEALKDIFIYPVRAYLRMRYYKYTLVYVPSSKKNLERRGFNHLVLMFQSLKLNSADILEKIEDISQNNLSIDKRKRMITNIRLKDGVKVPKHILLVDDVYTSGSSIYGSYLALKNYSKDIKAITIAYVTK